MRRFLFAIALSILVPQIVNAETPNFKPGDANKPYDYTPGFFYYTPGVAYKPNDYTPGDADKPFDFTPGDADKPYDYKPGEHEK
jgi:hypothetical protein